MVDTRALLRIPSRRRAQRNRARSRARTHSGKYYTFWTVPEPHAVAVSTGVEGVSGGATTVSSDTGAVSVAGRVNITGASGQSFFKASCSRTTQFLGPLTAPANVSLSVQYEISEEMTNL